MCHKTHQYLALDFTDMSTCGTIIQTETLVIKCAVFFTTNTWHDL